MSWRFTSDRPEVSTTRRKFCGRWPRVGRRRLAGGPDHLAGSGSLLAGYRPVASPAFKTAPPAAWRPTGRDWSLPTTLRRVSGAVLAFRSTGQRKTAINGWLTAVSVFGAAGGSICRRDDQTNWAADVSAGASAPMISAATNGHGRRMQR